MFSVERTNAALLRGNSRAEDRGEGGEGEVKSYQPGAITKRGWCSLCDPRGIHRDPLYDRDILLGRSKVGIQLCPAVDGHCFEPYLHSIANIHQERHRLQSQQCK